MYYLWSTLCSIAAIRISSQAVLPSFPHTGVAKWISWNAHPGQRYQTPGLWWARFYPACPPVWLMCGFGIDTIKNNRHESNSHLQAPSWLVWLLFMCKKWFISCVSRLKKKCFRQFGLTYFILSVRIHIYVYFTTCKSHHLFYIEMKVKSLLYMIKTFTQTVLSVVLLV